MFKIVTQNKFKQRIAQLPVSLRTDVGETVYAKAKAAGMTKGFLDEQPIREWKQWALIPNAFPYDAIFKVHHMLIPKRVVPESELTDAEWLELKHILDEMKNEYDCQLINFPKKQSIIHHYHIHLLSYKDHRSDLKLQ